MPNTTDKYRRNGLNLFTSGTNSSDPTEGDLCHSVSGRPDGTDIPDVLNVTCPSTWRYLTVYTETENEGGGPLLDFVEVQVWSCPSGRYGASCSMECNSRHCHNTGDSCNSDTGTCSNEGCQPGWAGPDCTACALGYYGSNCDHSCAARHCKVDSVCDAIQGECVGGCEAGYQGTDCRQEDGKIVDFVYLYPSNKFRPVFGKLRIILADDYCCPEPKDRHHRCTDYLAALFEHLTLFKRDKSGKTMHTKLYNKVVWNFEAREIREPIGLSKRASVENLSLPRLVGRNMTGSMPDGCRAVGFLLAASTVLVSLPLA
ncbi:fibropellin-1-like [Haliotis rubra]|uniref:fibropellin-1-like n=1 Tax=Haliotis rubra TaxID=36100 RepID=UPI001EE56E56|nr:fibropellin-1-like [Haliotis rubra]